MDATIEKLKRINQEIQNRDTHDQHLKNLIAIDLYSFIKKTPELNAIFNERIGFLQRLSENKDFIKLQKSLVDLSNQIIEVISTNKKIHNDFVIFGECNSFYCYYDFDSILKHDSNPIIKQYSDVLNTFDDTVKKNNLEDSNPSQFNKYIGLRDEFQKQLTELRRGLCGIGNELHVKQFEDYLGICSAMWPHPEDSSFTEFQNEYRDFTWKVISETIHSLENVKRTCKIVIEDLIDEINENTQENNVSKYRESIDNNLSLQDIKFRENESVIVVGNHHVSLPPYKNEYFFSRIMFEYPTNEFVDWSIIFEKMDEQNIQKISNTNTGKEARKQKRMIQDVMYATNNRIKKAINTTENLFSWENRSIKRNF